MEAQQRYAAGLIAGLVLAAKGSVPEVLARVRPLLQRYTEGDAQAGDEVVRVLQTDPYTAGAWRNPVFRDSDPERLQPEAGDDLLNIWVLFGSRLPQMPAPAEGSENPVPRSRGAGKE